MAKKGKSKGKPVGKKPKKEEKNEVKKAEKRLEEKIKSETEDQLRQKCKDLATIIEEMSSAAEEVPATKVENVLEPKLKELEQRFVTQLQDLKGGMESLEKKLKKPVKEKGELGDITGEIEEKIEPRLAGLEEQMKALGKISELEEKLKGLTGESKEGKEGKRVPKKLSILEDRIIKTMQEDLIEIKETVESLYNSFDTMRDRTEKKIQKIQEALTPETVKKLEELISFLDKAVPAKVKEEVGDKFNSIFDQLKTLREDTSALEEEMKKLLKEIIKSQQTIESFKGMKEDIARLQLEKDNLYKTAEDIKIKSIQMDNDLEFNFKTQIDGLMKKFNDFNATLDGYLKVAEERVNKSLSEFSKTKLPEIEKRYYTTVSSAHENIKALNSDLTKFEEIVNSTLSSIKTGMEKFNVKLEKVKETEKEELLKLEKRINTDKAQFEDTLKNYPKFIEENVEKLFSSLAQSKLADIEKKYHTDLISIKNDINSLETRLSNFENVVNSTFDSVRDSSDKFNLQLQRFKEKEKEDLIKLDNKILASKVHLDKALDALSDDLEENLTKDISQLKGQIEEQSKTIELNLNRQFSDLTKTKIQEIEGRYSQVLASIEQRAKELNSDISKFKDAISSNLNLVESKVEKFNTSLTKIEDKNKFDYLKLEKKIINNKGLFERELNAYPKIIEDRVNKLFSGLTESKISEMKKEHSDSLHWIEDNVNKMNSDLSGFKEYVNSNFNSLNTETKKIKRQLNKLIEEAKTVKSVKEDIKKAVSKKISDDFKDRLNSISTEISVLKGILKQVSDRLNYFDILDQKIAKLDNQRNDFLEEIEQQTAMVNSLKEMTKSELNKKLAADRAEYKDLLKKIMNEKRSLEEMMNKQKEKISTYLKELKT
jgi:DNA repair exonuclease SbcCD ATPase subunit